MNLYLIVADDEGPLYVLAKDMGEAIAKWKRWNVEQSDGAVSSLECGYWPESVSEVASVDQIIR